uniref:Ciliary associated calcium binding coiled-coil 1 n=2 Tax=Monodelphis domestica TaxID=13616 RepID=F6V307_MONDO
MEGFLNFQKLPTSLKEAILLDYFTSGFWWAKDKNFTVLQLSKFMALLDKLLQNLNTLHMSLEDSIKFLGEVMAEIGPTTMDSPDMNVFNVQQANEIIDYLKMSLFQHYKLYEFLFFSPRDEIVIGTEDQSGSERQAEGQEDVYLVPSSSDFLRRPNPKGCDSALGSSHPESGYRQGIQVKAAKWRNKSRRQT